jgi:hypothetical protein
LTRFGKVHQFSEKVFLAAEILSAGWSIPPVARSRIDFVAFTAQVELVPFPIFFHQGSPIRQACNKNVFCQSEAPRLATRKQHLAVRLKAAPFQNKL